MSLEDAFRQLRAAWYRAMLHRAAHEREWEIEEHERWRSVFDAHTEAIIDGEEKPIAPRWAADLK